MIFSYIEEFYWRYFPVNVNCAVISETWNINPHLFAKNWQCGKRYQIDDSKLASWKALSRIGVRETTIWYCAFGSFIFQTRCYQCFSQLIKINNNVPNFEVFIFLIDAADYEYKIENSIFKLNTLRSILQEKRLDFPILVLASQYSKASFNIKNMIFSQSYEKVFSAMLDIIPTATEDGIEVIRIILGFLKLDTLPVHNIKVS